MKISDFQDDIYNPVLEDTVKGFAKHASLENLKKDYTTITIPLGMEYRPDLIAECYLGDATKAWMIDAINNFTDGIEKYTLGKSIKIPNL